MQYLPWHRFREYLRVHWRQGEHVSIIGRTGSGKTLLAFEVVKLREHVVLLLTKGHDRTADRFIEQNDYEVISRWPPSGFDNKVALWPKFTGVDSFRTQSQVFQAAINGNRKAAGIYADGGWTVLIDEVMYFTGKLRLDEELDMLWTQGRSNDISLVAATQRPRNIPQVMLDQCSHLFVFQTSDRYELGRLTDIGGNVASIIKETVPHLAEHEFLYVNLIKGITYRSKVTK